MIRRQVRGSSEAETDSQGPVRSQASRRSQQPLMAEQAARLKKRADFLRAAKGRRYFTAAFNLQSVARPVADSCEFPPRFGFTVTKKNGNSVERNRIRRRMREAVRKAVTGADALAALPGHDYVIVARREAINRPFDVLVQDLRTAFTEIHQERARRNRNRRQQ